jgi:hypothetical protein
MGVVGDFVGNALGGGGLKYSSGGMHGDDMVATDLLFRKWRGENIKANDDDTPTTETSNRFLMQLATRFFWLQDDLWS